MVSKPFRALFAAAKGSPALAKYQAAFKNAPFDLHVVLTGEDPEGWLPHSGMGQGPKDWWRKIEREASRLPEGSIVLVQGEPAHRRMRTYGDRGGGIMDHLESIESGRRGDAPTGFALMTPFTVAHRLFDAALTRQPVVPLISGEIQDAVIDGFDGQIDWRESDRWGWFREKLVEGLIGTIGDTDWHAEATRLIAQEQQISPQEVDEDEVWERVEELKDPAMDDAVEAYVGRFDAAVEAMVRGVGAGSLGYPWDAGEAIAAHHPDKGGAHRALPSSLFRFDSDRHLGEADQWARRVLCSLICPTAAGRRFLLTDMTQAGADCFATWVISYNPSKGRGRIPLMPISPIDARDFRAERWVDRWAKDHGGRRMSPRKRERYLRELQQLEPAIRLMLAHKDVGSEAVAWSRAMAEVFPATMKGAVEVLKAYRVVSL